MIIDKNILKKIVLEEMKKVQEAPVAPPQTAQPAAAQTAKPEETPITPEITHVNSIRNTDIKNAAMLLTAILNPKVGANYLQPSQPQFASLVKILKSYNQLQVLITALRTQTQQQSQQQK